MAKKPNIKKQKALWTPRIPRALYTTGFNDIAEQWHKNPKAPKELVNVIQLEMVIEGFRVAEGLIVAPAVCSHVFGENVVLCRLIDGFGLKAVEQLLEEDALQFILWRPMVVHMVNQLEGVEPILGSNHNSLPHCDPEASVEMGLKRWLDLPWEKVKRVAKLAVERTHLPAENVPHDAVKAVKHAYDRGALRKLGFDPSIPRYRLVEERRGVLSGMAEGIAMSTVLRELEFDIHESAAAWRQVMRTEDIARGDGIVKAVEQGLRVENVPNIPALMANGVLRMDDIAQFRRNPATQELRKWLWEQPDPHNAEAVAQAWLATIKDKPLKDKTWFKAVRLSVATAVGLVAGAAALEVAGAVAGSVAGAAALNGVLSAADTFGVEKLLSKPSPRRFADLLRQKMAEHNAPTQPPEGNRRQRRAKNARRTRKPQSG